MQRLHVRASVCSVFCGCVRVRVSASQCLFFYSQQVLSQAGAGRRLCFQTVRNCPLQQQPPCLLWQQTAHTGRVGRGGTGGGRGTASGPAQSGLPLIFLSVSDFDMDLPSSIRAARVQGEICETLLHPRTFPLRHPALSLKIIRGHKNAKSAFALISSLCLGNNSWHW